MAPTSDERREVAERLRSLAARGQGISCDAVDKELGIWYDDSYFGCVFACESVLRLADLIDPSDYDQPHEYCPNCGCRVVSNDE